MPDWQATLAAPVEAAQHGVDAADAHFNSVHDGPFAWDRIDYPAAQTHLDGFERVDGTNWRVSVSTVLYFAWDRETTTTEDVLHPLAAVLEHTLSAMSDIGCITDYHPSRVDFFSGEPQNSLVVAVSIQFQAMTLLDPGTFGDG